MKKLSELNTDEMLDKVCELMPHFNEIVTDKEVKKILSDKLKVDAESKEDVMEQGFEKGLEIITKLIPTLLKKRRKAMYSILAIVSEVPIDTIKEQPITITIKQIKELVQDEGFTELFTTLS